MEDKHIENSGDFKNLKVNDGVEEVNIVNPNSIKNFKKKRQAKINIPEIIEGIIKGDITTLSRAITLIESSKPEHQKLADEIIKACLPYSGKSKRIGITGVPGVGKSTFIEALGTELAEKGHKLAILAIDPSSEKSKGSILGDKTRMENLVKSKNAFIRPSPSSGSLGGVARKTRESIILCEAAGFDTIFIETVGVGQSETAVHSMSDFFLLLMLAGAGDELQGIKRGIMEMADTIAITKADGDNKIKAIAAETEYKNALHLLPNSNDAWTTKVLSCSSVDHFGINDLWGHIEEFFKIGTTNNSIQEKRMEQAKYWMHETIKDKLITDLYSLEDIKALIKNNERAILENQISPFKAADDIFSNYKSSKSN
jgi:LAO/AO transport system kinase